MDSYWCIIVTTPRLLKNLMSDLIWTVTSWEPEELLAIPIAKFLYVAKGMAGPANRQEYGDNVRPDDVGHELFDRLVLASSNPNQILQAESRFQRCPSVWASSVAKDKQSRAPV